MALDQDLQEVLLGCYQHSEVAAKTLFPGRFSRAFDRAHRQMFEVIDDDSVQKIVIAAPRGIGKTSIANLLTPARHTLFKKSRYIVPVSASATLAVQQSENLKRELTQNTMIKKLFGDIRTDSFSKEQWVANIAGEDVCIMPRGAGQQVRGMLYKDYRPDLIIIDDLEDSEKVASAEQRAKLKEWFFGDLLNCVDRSKNNYRYIYLDTLKHELSLLNELLEMPGWVAVRLELCDDNLISYFPNFMPSSEVQKLYQDYHAAGKIDTFYREYRNQANAGGEDAVFQSRFFKYYEESDFELNNDPFVENILLLDPARTANMASAETGIIVPAINTANNCIFVRDVLGKKLHPHEMYDEVCNRIEQFNIRVMGVEVTGLHEFITHPLRNELARRNLNVEVIELHARGGVDEKGKVARIKSLAHYYRLGLIYHNKSVTAPLEAQLLSFPRARRWDIMDAFGYLPEILERGDRFMRPFEGEIESVDEVNEEMALLTEWDDMLPIEFGII